MAYPNKKTKAKRATARFRLAQRPRDDLGVVPTLVAAAIPSVRQLALKALNSVAGIFDPGKRRDANRKARAQMWGDLAVAGSITAARRVYGGQTLVYTDKERQYYRDQWKRLQSAESTLASQAISLGGMAIPEPGSDQEPAKLPDEDVASLQREIDAYRTGSASLTPNAPLSSPATPTQAGFGSFLGVGLLVTLALRALRRGGR